MAYPDGLVDAVRAECARLHAAVLAAMDEARDWINADKIPTLAVGDADVPKLGLGGIATRATIAGLTVTNR